MAFDITIIIAAVFGIIIGIILGAFIGIIIPLIKTFMVKKNSAKKIMDQPVTFRMDQGNGKSAIYDLKEEIKKELNKNSASLSKGEKAVLSSHPPAAILTPSTDSSRVKEEGLIKEHKEKKKIAYIGKNPGKRSVIKESKNIFRI